MRGFLPNFRNMHVAHSQMFVRRTLAAAVVMVGAGCTRPQTVGDAAVLSRALRAEYHRPVTVTLDGQRGLIVTLEADSTGGTRVRNTGAPGEGSIAADSAAGPASADSADTPAAQAYRVATFVGSHYDHAGTLRALTVIVEPAAGDSAEGPSISTFSGGEIVPQTARAVPPGTKSD
jgi:hypothetical protein